MMLAAIRHNHFSTWGMCESIPHHQELGTALQNTHHSDWYIPLGLRYLKVVGKKIDGSGFSDILLEARLTIEVPCMVFYLENTTTE